MMIEVTHDCHFAHEFERFVSLKEIHEFTENRRAGQALSPTIRRVMTLAHMHRYVCLLLVFFMLLVINGWSYWLSSDWTNRMMESGTRSIINQA